MNTKSKEARSIWSLLLTFASNHLWNWTKKEWDET